MKMKVRGICRHLSWIVFLGTAGGLAVASAQTLRVVSYNIDCEDQGSDNNITASYAGIPTVIQAIGNHHLGANSQPVDVLGVEELNSTTLANLVTALNNIYGAGTYTYDHTTDPNTGGGPDGLIYNTHTVQVISAHSVGDGTYSGAVGAAITSPVSSVPRSPMRYQLRPVGYGSNADFYMYVSHARSTSDNSTGSARYMEAQEIRNDANSLPANSHIIYSGDWNLFNGNNLNGQAPNGANAENAYLCLTGQATSDGHNWSGGTQAYDPTSPTTTVTSWKNSDTSGASNYLYNDSTTSLTSRLDLQLVSSAMLNQPGLQLATDTSDPFTHNYPSSKYPYAYEEFGNDGTTAEGHATNLAGNTSLSDLPNASTVLKDLMQFGTGSQFTGSDHLPVVADYTLVGVQPLPVPGDFNRDGRVTLADISAMLAALVDLNGYETSRMLTDPQLQVIGDLNGDGKVTNADIQALLDLLATQSSGNRSVTAVPEPSSLVLLVLALPLIVARLRCKADDWPGGPFLRLTCAIGLLIQIKQSVQFGVAVDSGDCALHLP
jgi:hypothetical protein